MLSTKLLVETLESTTAEHPPRPRRIAVWKTLLISALVVLVLSDITMLGQSLWDAWHMGDWQANVWRWFEQLSSLTAVTLPIVFAVIFASLQETHIRERLRPGLSALIAAAASGDERLAPTASRQLIPFAEGPSSGSAKGTHFTLSGWLRNDNQRPVFSLAALVPVAILVQALEFIFIPATDTIHMLGFTQGVVGVVSCVAYVGIARSAQHTTFVRLIPYAQRVKSVVADAKGIAWLLPSFLASKSYIWWTEARAFVMLANQLGTGEDDDIYALVGREAIFVWVVTPRSSEAERRASDLFCQLIATHTALPLRDISGAMAALDAATPHAAMLWSERVRVAKEVGTAIPLPRHKHRMPLVWPLLVFYTLFPMLYYGAAYVAQHNVTP